MRATWIQKNAELSPSSVNLEKRSNRWGRSTTFSNWVMNYPLCCFISTRLQRAQFYGIHSVDVTIYHIHPSAHLFAIHASILSLGGEELAESSHTSSKFYFVLHFAPSCWIFSWISIIPAGVITSAACVIAFHFCPFSSDNPHQPLSE